MSQKTKSRLLIIAQPKSASTSLLVALSNITSLSAAQQFTIDSSDTMTKKSGATRRAIDKVQSRLFNKDQHTTKKLSDAFPASNFGILSRMHADIFDLRDNSIPNGLFQNSIHKQHIPPTSGNFRLTSSFNVVLLTRPISETIDAYSRVPHTRSAISLRNQIINSSIFREELEDELVRWQLGWEHYATNHPVQKIDFLELIQNTDKVLKSIVRTLDFEPDIVSHNYQLPRERVYQRR